MVVRIWNSDQLGTGMAQVLPPTPFSQVLQNPDMIQAGGGVFLV